jgi:type IV pilus assembly protein PilB
MFEIAFTNRADKGFGTLEEIIRKIDESPVNVESDVVEVKKVIGLEIGMGIGCRKKDKSPDSFCCQSYDFLRNKGVLPIIYDSTKRELTIAIDYDKFEDVSPSAELVDFSNLNFPFKQALPQGYKGISIEEGNVSAIKVDKDEFNKLYQYVLNPTERKQYVSGRDAISKENEIRIAREKEVRIDKMKDSPAVDIVRQKYRAGIFDGASDIHFEWTEMGPRIRYRIKGILRDDDDYNLEKQRELTLEQRKEVNARFLNVIGAIKADASNNGVYVEKHGITQDGTIDFDELKWSDSVDKQEIPGGYFARVSVMPSVFGEGIALRLFPKGQMRTLNQLGYSKPVVSQLEEIATEPHGIILVTGPTGSGKTTTIYSLLQQVNSPTRKIITIENPVENKILGIEQFQVNGQNSFADLLRASLRHDPDVMLIGEIRDLETASIAIRAALTGHLVYASLHTNDAPSAVTRLLDMGIAKYEIQDSVKAILAQRLVRINCDNCKVEDNASKHNLLFRDRELLKDIVIYDSVDEGCGRCGKTGIISRSAITEIWQISEAARDLIGKGSNAITDYLELAIKEGMRPLAITALDHLIDGKISMRELVRTVGIPEYKRIENFVGSMVSEKVKGVKRIPIVI